MAPLKIFFELGRAITGPYGYLVAKVRHVKNTYKSFVGLDACMVNLMRPAMYGAYHHITAVGKENETSLENNVIKKIGPLNYIIELEKFKQYTLSLDSHRNQHLKEVDIRLTELLNV